METALPVITAIQPVRSSAPFDDPEWIFELNHDGVRALAYIEHGCCRLLGCDGREIREFTELCLRIGESLNAKDAILDGELCCIGKDGQRTFTRHKSAIRQAYYYTFDLLWLNGKDLQKWPLLRRKAKLKSIVPRSLGPILYTGHTDGKGTRLFGEACNCNLDGIIARRKDSSYDCSERRTTWIKIANPLYIRSQGGRRSFSPIRE
jgi:bifunctional non-homologous end joining protein LigD